MSKISESSASSDSSLSSEKATEWASSSGLRTMELVGEVRGLLLKQLHLRSPWLQTARCLGKHGAWVMRLSGLTLFTYEEQQQRAKVSQSQIITMNASIPPEGWTCMVHTQTDNTQLLAIASWCLFWHETPHSAKSGIRCWCKTLTKKWDSTEQVVIS